MGNRAANRFISKSSYDVGGAGGFAGSAGLHHHHHEKGASCSQTQSSHVLGREINANVMTIAGFFGFGVTVD